MSAAAPVTADIVPETGHESGARTAGSASGPATGPGSGASAAPAPHPRAAMAVVRAMMRELDRQVREGTMRSAHPVDANGMTTVDGRLDLAMLAFVAEMALLGQFPSLGARR